MHDKKKEEITGIKHPDLLLSYFKKEMIPLLFVTITGLIYNIGLAAEPYFEGQLVQKLLEVLKEKSTFYEMLFLAGIYVCIILFVQGARCMKRFFTRRFANDTSRNMRHMIYNFLIHQKKSELETESIGTLMTKTMEDVDACSEGMRKFLTEIFDTGIALLSYLVLMLYYDWRLTLVSVVFVVVAVYMAQRMKSLVYRYNVAYKKTAERLNDATLDRVAGSITYRVTGRENARNQENEGWLLAYEKAAVKSNIWESALPPVYNVISMASVVVILYFGGKNVLGTGYQIWGIGMFTTFVSCFAKMAIKSSKVAKLLNSVQKARVSWKRIKPLMHEYTLDSRKELQKKDEERILELSKVSFGYEGGVELFHNLSFEAKSGEMVGVTGPVACGKSSFGRLFLGEENYRGSIRYQGRELNAYSDYERNTMVSYLGHLPELMSDTIANNICMGEKKDCMPYIKAVCLDQEIEKMPKGIYTSIGANGIRLSGGQQARLALARTLYHGSTFMVLDDPFAAVDLQTERCIMKNIRAMFPKSLFIIISHRVSLFSSYDRIVWMGENARVSVGTHNEMLQMEPGYAEIYSAQQSGGDLDA